MARRLIQTDYTTCLYVLPCARKGSQMCSYTFSRSCSQDAGKCIDDITQTILLVVPASLALIDQKCMQGSCYFQIALKETRFSSVQGSKHLIYGMQTQSMHHQIVPCFLIMH